MPPAELPNPLQAKWYYQPATGFVFDYNPYLLPPPLTVGPLKVQGPFNSKEEAYAFYEREKGKHPDWKDPKNISPDIPGPSIPDVAGGVEALYRVLTSKNLWIRVAEFSVGILLLAIGANALLRQASGVNVGRIATKVVTKGAV
jgi:hypothetical protein